MCNGAIDWSSTEKQPPFLLFRSLAQSVHHSSCLSSLVICYGWLFCVFYRSAGGEMVNVPYTKTAYQRQDVCAILQDLNVTENRFLFFKLQNNGSCLFFCTMNQSIPWTSQMKIHCFRMFRNATINVEWWFMCAIAKEILELSYANWKVYHQIWVLQRRPKQWFFSFYSYFSQYEK